MHGPNIARFYIKLNIWYLWAPCDVVHKLIAVDFWQSWLKKPLINLFLLVFSCSGEVYVHHANWHSVNQNEGEEERTGALLLPGRAQVLHPLATLQKTWQGQKWVTTLHHTEITQNFWCGRSLGTIRIAWELNSAQSSYLYLLIMMS